MNLEEQPQAKNNKVDHNAFKSFVSELDPTYNELERKRMQLECKQNLKDWLSKLPTPWQQANLTDINLDVAKKADQILKTEGMSSFFIQGKENSGKTYLSYAILRRYVGKGWATPSQIKFMTEQELMSMSYTGFLGKQEFNELLNSDYKVFVIDDVGTCSKYRLDQELLLWQRFVEHVYSKGLTIILTSAHSLSAFVGKLSASSRVKLESMLKIHQLQIGNMSEKQTSDMSTIANSGLFNF